MPIKLGYLTPAAMFLVGGLCGAALGINWTVPTLSPFRLVPVTQNEAARSYGVGQGTALMNCILLKQGLIAEGGEDVEEAGGTPSQLLAFDVRWRSLHWSKYPVEWNSFWQGFNDTVNYYRESNIHSLSKYSPGICGKLEPLGLKL